MCVCVKRWGFLFFSLQYNFFLKRWPSVKTGTTELASWRRSNETVSACTKFFKRSTQQLDSKQQRWILYSIIIVIQENAAAIRIIAYIRIYYIVLSRWVSHELHKHRTSYTHFNIYLRALRPGCGTTATANIRSHTFSFQPFFVFLFFSNAVKRQH